MRAIEVPEGDATRIAAHQLRWAACEFSYDSDARAIILDKCAPLLWSTAAFQPLRAVLLQKSHRRRDIALPGDVCIGMLEIAAREALSAYLAGPVRPPPPAAERDRLTEVAECAERLVELLANDPGKWPFPAFPHELGFLAGLCRGCAGQIESEFDHPIFGVHDPIRHRLALRVLRCQEVETGKKPGDASNSRAARLLIASVNPVVEFARDRIGVETASYLSADHARYLVQQYLSGRFADVFSAPDWLAQSATQRHNV